MRMRIAACMLAVLACSSTAFGGLDQDRGQAEFQRHIVVAGEHEGRVTIAGSLLMGPYPPGTSVDSLCADPPGNAHARSPECLLSSYLDAVERGAMRELEAMHVQGDGRQQAIQRLEQRLPALQQQMSEYTGYRAHYKTVWDDFVLIVYRGIKKDGSLDMEMGIGAELNKEGTAYGITDNFDRLFPGYPTSYLAQPGVEQQFGQQVRLLDNPPPGSLAFRMSLKDGPRGMDRVVAEMLGPADTIERDNLILYLRPERYPADAPPFLQWEPRDLGDAGRQLQSALRRQIDWQQGGGASRTTLQEMLEDWHPSCRDSVARGTRRELEHNERRFEGRFEFRRIRIPGVSGKRSAESLRISARIPIDDGMIWLGWYPSLHPNAENAGSANDAIAVTLLQFRADDGTYKLLRTPSDIVTDAESYKKHVETKYAMSLCYGAGTPIDSTHGVSGVVWPLTRLQREAQLDDPMGK